MQRRKADWHIAVQVTRTRSVCRDSGFVQTAFLETTQATGPGAIPSQTPHEASGQRNWSKAAQAIAKIDAARADGLDIGANMYAYTAGATTLTGCLRRPARRMANYSTDWPTQRSGPRFAPRC